MDFIVKINPLSSKRHCFVLVAIDYSTKWTEAILLKNMIHSRDNLYSDLFYLHQICSHKTRERKEAVDTQNWHDEGFLDNMGRTGQTSPLNRSDLSLEPVRPV